MFYELNGKYVKDAKWDRVTMTKSVGDKLSPFQQALLDAAWQLVASWQDWESKKDTDVKSPEAKFRALVERAVDITEVIEANNKVSSMIANGIAEYAKKSTEWIK